MAPKLFSSAFRRARALCLSSAQRNPTRIEISQILGLDQDADSASRSTEAAP
jgi:hypothetical protein